MRILGIDPGLKATGFGVVEEQGRGINLLEFGAIEPKQKESFQNRILKVYTAVDGLIVKYEPEVLVLEKLYAHYNHPTTACILGHVRGVICLLCALHKVELVEHSVKRIRKAITGNGNASKLQTQKVALNILNISGAKISLDASDALALALGYINMSKSSVYAIAGKL